MKRNLVLIACLSAACAQGADTEELSRQLKQMEETLQKQQAQINELKRQLEASKTNVPPPAAQPPLPVVEQQRPALAGAQTAPWSPAQPIRIGGAQNYINLSFDALVAAGTSTANDIEGGTQLGG